MCTNLKARQGCGEVYLVRRIWSLWHEFQVLGQGELEGGVCMVSSDECLRGLILLDLRSLTVVLAFLPSLVWVTAFWGKIGIPFELHSETFTVRENSSHYLNYYLAKWHRDRCLGPQLCMNMRSGSLWILAVSLGAVLGLGLGRK